MQISQILIFIIGALLVALSPRWRGWLLLVLSTAAIFWVQPTLPIRYLDFWLPSITIGIIIFTWIVTRDFNNPISKEDLQTILLTLALVLSIGLNRYLGPVCCLLTSRPPMWSQVLIGMVIFAFFSMILWGMKRRGFSLLNFMTIILLIVFIVLKDQAFTQAASLGLRFINHQDISNASALDIRWVGFSYVAFRLIHVLRDRAAGRLKDMNLRKLLIYTIFFPAFTAGPIDRIQRFLPDLDRSVGISGDSAWLGGYRISIGLLKKFVLADTLALIALNDLNAGQTRSTVWLWVLVFIYAFRLYFDFSGYTDIAIGTAKLMGFNLPENFNAPYVKPNLTLFWNSWHMTLAQWFRTYYFNPLTRRIRSDFKNIPVWGVILFGQVTTMALIGLWHGFTANFLIWGLWHGIGLFAHNRWTELAQPKLVFLEQIGILKSILKPASILFTFTYVSLGWVWFALSSPSASWRVLVHLAGF